MIRGDFLRVGFLAPLAALLGCKKKAPPIHLETSEGEYFGGGRYKTVEIPLAQSPIQATAWTITTTGNIVTGTATVWVSEPGGRWYRVRP